MTSLRSLEVEQQFNWRSHFWLTRGFMSSSQNKQGFSHNHAPKLVVQGKSHSYRNDSNLTVNPPNLMEFLPLRLENRKGKLPRSMRSLLYRLLPLQIGVFSRRQMGGNYFQIPFNPIITVEDSSRDKRGREGHKQPTFDICEGTPLGPLAIIHSSLV